MDFKGTIHFTSEETKIDFPEYGSLIISKNETKTKQSAVSLEIKDKIVVAIKMGKTNEVGKEVDQLVKILPPEDIETIYVAEKLLQQAEEAGMTNLIESAERINIPANHLKRIEEYTTHILLVLEKFGIILQPKPKKKPAKAQHRWNKAVSQMEFFVDDFDSKATVIWQKRNEMLIKAGAVMKQEMPLNKDGSVGMSARMAEKIRAENADKFKDFVTTEDIVLKSVNEVGLFLYFAGTNSWLVLKDKDGKTIDEWTVVK